MADHRLLAIWAADCSERVLHILLAHSDDTRPTVAIETARAWSTGDATVDDARNASIACHASARDLGDASPAAIAAARSAGHAVATAHMADHCLRASRYALSAVTNAGLDTEAEQYWQITHLPNSVLQLVVSALKS
jgi:phosphoribosylformylglycinamidine (FGAM) synthase-like enzyme